MKLNSKGWDLFYKWREIYDKSLQMEIAEHGERDAEYGWCIIEDHGFVNNADDEVGLLVYGDDDDAIHHIIENTDDPGEEWAFGGSSRQMVERLLPYFDLDEEDEISIKAFLGGTSDEKRV